MILTFLGTGTSQGVPVITCGCEVCTSSDPRDKRLRTSAMLTTDDGLNILFDVGPDFRQQMLLHHISHIDAILITHAHRDHVAGLDDIRAFNYAQHSALDIYLNTQAAQTLRRDYQYIFSPHDYPGLPEANLHIVDASTSDISIQSLSVTPIAAIHKDLPILGYRIGDFAYITDANHIPPQEMAKLSNLKVLVLNALRPQHHWSHFSLPEALELIEQIHPQQAYLTHISHEMGLHAKVSLQLPESVHLAYDGLTLDIS